MSDAALRRLTSLLELAPVVPPRQRLAWYSATDAALDAASAEADALADPTERVMRDHEIMLRLFRLSPPGWTRAQMREVIDADREAAALYVESLAIDDPRERAALRRSAGMPPALAERMRSLATEGRL